MGRLVGGSNWPQTCRSLISFSTSTPLSEPDGRITAVLGGHVDDPNWNNDINRTGSAAMESARQNCRLPLKAQEHRRGNYSILSSGYSHGGGQTHPQNVANSKKNAEIVEGLNKMDCFQRLARFTSCKSAHILFPLETDQLQLFSCTGRRVYILTTMTLFISSKAMTRLSSGPSKAVYFPLLRITLALKLQLSLTLTLPTCHLDGAALQPLGIMTTQEVVTLFCLRYDLSSSFQPAQPSLLLLQSLSITTYLLHPMNDVTLLLSTQLAHCFDGLIMGFVMPSHIEIRWIRVAGRRLKSG